jgi:phage terminase large subunit-like protein
LSVIISTQAPSNNDLLSLLIDDALAAHDPHVICSLYRAKEEDDPFCAKTIKQANPAFGDFLNKKEVMAMAESARRMPAREADFRNLVLNQRVDVSNPFISRSTWEACGTEAVDLQGMPVFGGLDLSATQDLTAFVLVGKTFDGIWHVKPTFWLPEEGLRERARKDHFPYDVWARDGFLKTTPGKSVAYDFVATYLRDTLSQMYVEKIAFDAWNFKHLREALLRVGFSAQRIESTFVEFRQGYKSMSPALRTLEELILTKRLAHGNHPVLSMCAANAVVTRDAADNRKLDKAKANGRIDGMVALAMAVSLGAAPDAVIDIETMIA